MMGARGASLDSLGLGEEVGEEDLVVLAAGNRVEGLRGGEEVTEDQHVQGHRRRTKG